MITDDKAEGALSFLHTNARKAAQVRAEAIYMQEYRKVIKAQIMREEPDKPEHVREARAYADPRYIKHLDAMKTAIENDEYMRWMRVYAESTIAAWQTQSANSRSTP